MSDKPKLELMEDDSYRVCYDPEVSYPTRRLQWHMKWFKELKEAEKFYQKVLDKYNKENDKYAVKEVLK